MTTEKDIDVVIGEIKGAISIQLAMAALSGDRARQITEKGRSLQDVADALDAHPDVLQTKIDLAARLGELMRSDGCGLADALDKLLDEGWLDRLDAYDDMGEEV